MKSTILLLALSAAAFSSCTTAYKTGQTPDDVYFSPARPEEEYVRVDKDEDREYRYDDDYYDDRYLRMKVRNRDRWSDLDEWYYYGKTSNYYGYGYRYNWSAWNPYNSWNYYYNPYCKSCCVSSGGNVKSVVYNRPRTFNLNGYNTGNGNTSGGKIFNPSNTNNNNTYSSPRNTRNTRERENTGNFLREVFRSSNNSTRSSSTNTNSSSSGSSSGSSGSSGGSAPVRKF
jgi:hypothetical protein